MQRVGSRFLTVVLALMLGISLVPAGAESASAATPSCYGNSCEGKDPAKTTCVNDARTLLSREASVDGASYGVLELRYSPSCYSNWVRFTPWGGLRGYLGYASGGVVTGTPWIWRSGVANSLRGPIASSSPYGSQYTTWTAMVTAAGTTCSSVGLTWTEKSTSGQGARRSLGTYNAPCIS